MKLVITKKEMVKFLKECKGLDDEVEVRLEQVKKINGKEK